LANNIVYAIVAEPNGRIWAGTDLGLSFFEGQEWQIVLAPMEADSTITRSFVKALALDQQGGLWIGTEGAGLSRLDLSEPASIVESSLIEFDQAAWKTYTEGDGLLSNRISALAIDQAGQVWAGTPFGLSRFDGQRWTNFTQAGGLPSHLTQALAVDPAGRVWVAAHSYQGGGVSWFDGQRWVPFLSENRLNDQAVLALAGDEQGFLWLGTNGAGLKQKSLPPLDPATQPETAALPEKIYQTQDGPAGDGLWTVVSDAGGRLWFGTRENGLTLFDGQTWQPYAAGRVGDEVTTILLGAEGAIWVGTHGLSHFDGQLWTSYTYDDGLASNSIAGLALDPSGRLWVATTSEGVSVFDGQGWTTYTTAQGLADNFVHAVAVDKNGRVWVGTNTGVSVFDGQTWHTFTTADGLADDLVWAIVVDPANHIWLGTASGLSELVLAEPGNAPQWTTHLAGRVVDTLALDPAGQIWASGSSQVYRFDGQAWSSYDFPTLNPLRIEGLTFDLAGQVWVATFDEGVIRFNPATWPTTSP
jgi:ligand-binding sensor domain-containing protein